MAYTKYSLTPANNTAAPPDGAPEGMLPSAVNDTMRDMMAQIRDCGDGIRDGTYTMTAPKITGGTITGAAFTGNTFTSPVISGGTINNAVIGGSTAAAGTFTSLSDSGNLTFTGTGNRITGDMSNATIASRLMFQNSTTDAVTVISAIPNGTATQTNLEIYNKSDPNGSNNPSLSQLLINSSEVSVRSTIRGSGTYLPLTMYTGGSERLRIDTSGNVGIGTSSPNATCRLDISQTSRTRFDVSTATVINTVTNAAANAYATLRIDSADYQFYTGGSEKMRIDSSGNVGIGTTAPQQRLGIKPASNVPQLYMIQDNVANDGWKMFADSSAGYLGFLRTSSGSDTERMRIDSSGNVGINNTSPAVLSSTTQVAIKANASADSMFVAQNSNGLTTAKFGFQFTGGVDNPVIGSYTNHPFLFLTNNTERMRVGSDGALLVGTSSNTTNGGFIFNPNFYGTGRSTQVIGHINGASSGDAYIVFNYNGTGIGSITQNGTTATAYNTSSDYRLKENIAPMTGALATVAQLKPVTYTWKSTGEASQGFIAHELQEVCPDAVTGEKDAVDAEGKPVYQGVDTSFLVATLTAAIQELKAELDSVKAELQTLKGN